MQMHPIPPTLAELKLIDVIAEPIQKMNRLAPISILKALAGSPDALPTQLTNMARRGTSHSMTPGAFLSAAVEPEDKPQLGRAQSKIASHSRPTLAEETRLGSAWLRVGCMANRTFQLMLAMLASAVLTATSGSAAPPADECLTKPKGPAPAGKHWYYQTNRTTQRKCWYLADAGAKIVEPARPKAAASAPPDDRGTTMQQPPVANAHAELTEQPQARQPAVPMPQPLPETPTQSKPETSQGAADGTNTRNWALASRWPDQSIAYSSDRTATVDDRMPVSQAEDPRSVLAANPVAPVEQPSIVAENSYYLPFGQIVAALIVVVVVGGVIFMSLVSRRRHRSLATVENYHTESV
ncbi:hypothetical protein [Bradyrhizobium sp. LHD-71]|uniref:hypothetical protein n=1 Tax=Bradyrhizobium sp. LHD-71 TaxID=3072141 RepID=UPI00280F1D6B|nr:hypothetical protein [Bradyrhizobium sp. LHD-71]MDQ8729809.1 hypothetical protein [Bradyrhizobium sp. LHD-71]